MSLFVSKPPSISHSFHTSPKFTTCFIDVLELQNGGNKTIKVKSYRTVPHCTVKRAIPHYISSRNPCYEVDDSKKPNCWTCKRRKFQKTKLFKNVM